MPDEDQAEMTEEVAAQARAEASAHNPHAPPPHEEALMQRERNLRGVADTIENRLLRLENAVFGDTGIVGPMEGKPDEASDQG